MVANPNQVPDAFRKRRAQPSVPPSFIGMTDDEVLKIAANALHMVQVLPLLSKPRRDQWASYEAAAAELGRRAISQTLAKIWVIHELEARGQLGDDERQALEPGEQ